MQPRFLNLSRSLLFFFLPLIIFVWTSIAFTAPYTIHASLIAIVIGIALAFAKNQNLQLTKTVVSTLIVLLLVGGTGWFVSPFFFLLYLLPIYLGFLYVPLVAFAFLGALLIIFGFSVGEVDVAFDIMILLSLLTVIPLVIYLRKKYLILRQTDKDILILQDESAIKDADTIGKLLANRVTNLGVNVRQPLTFIKQASQLLLSGALDKDEQRTHIERIRITAEETIDMIRSFETETSANEVIRKKAKQIHKPHK